MAFSSCQSALVQSVISTHTLAPSCGQIPVRITNRSIIKRNNISRNISNLCHVSCQNEFGTLPVVKLRMGLLNVRSLGKKSFLVNDIISSNNLDFMFLTETWLDTGNCSTTLIETAPPNYLFLNSVREGRKGGGIAALFNSEFVCSQMTFGNFESFEYLAFLIKTKPNVLMTIIYRPPKASRSAFLTELGEFLSVICTDFDLPIVTGDFNIHMDSQNDKYANELTTLLESFGLNQHVKEPTHSHGHTLDLIISRDVQMDINVLNCALSDHYLVFFSFSLACVPTVAGSTVVQKRHINDTTRAQFVEMISFGNLSCTNVDDMLDSYTSSVLGVLDTIAPIKTRMLKNKQKAPWRNEELVRAQKRECRKAERRWRKSKVQDHYEIYKENLRVFNRTVRQAR